MKYAKAFLFPSLVILPFLGKSQEVKITSVSFPFDPDLTNVVGMCQDDTGFIWLADNASGLVKYDGTNKKYFKAIPNNPNSLYTNALECLYAGKGGIVWIGSNHEGLDRLDASTETFTHYQHDPSDPHSLRDNQIQALLEDRSGTLWIGTLKGLDTLDRKTGHFVHIRDDTPAGRLFNEATVRSIYEDHAGRIWIGAGNAFDPRDQPSSGLYKFEKETGLITHYRHNPEDPTSLIGNRIRALFEDRKGNFYVGSDGDGLHLMDREQGKFQRLTNIPGNPNALSRPPVNPNALYAADHITFINEDAQGAIWIGSYAGGINRYHPESKTMEFFGTSGKGSHYLEKNDFWTLLKTKDNLLWVSGWEPETENQVLFQISTFQNQFDYTPIGQRIILFAQDQESGIWIGASRGLYGQSMDESPGSFFTFVRNTLGSSIIWDLKFDNAGNLWVATLWGGAYFFDRQAMNFKLYGPEEQGKNGLSCCWVSAVLPMLDGTTWIGSYGGLDLFNSKSGEFTNFKHDPSNPNSLISSEVTSLFQDSNGRIWIGTRNGLNRYREESADFERYLNGAGVPVMGIHEDSNKRIWVSSYRAGFFLFDPEEGVFNPFYDNTGLITDLLLITGIVEDESKFIWLFTDSGLIRLDPDTKNAALFGNSWKKPADTEFYTLKPFISKNKEIFVGNASGYFSFQPGELEKQYPKEPNPYLSAFFLGDRFISSQTDKKILPKQLNETTEIRLAHHQNTFTLEFGSIDFVTLESEKNLRYKLENFDQNWRDGKAYTASYYSLPPGEYIFHVLATNRYGNLGQRSISIVVMPPWFTQWWAWLSYAFLLFLLLYLVYSFLLRRKLAQAEVIRLQDLDLVKSRLYTNLTHEFRTPLTVISGIADQILENPKQWLREGIPMIKRNSGQLMGLINQMLDLAKLESGTLPVKMVQDNVIHYLKYLTESFHSYAESKNIRLHFLASIDELYMDFDPEKMQSIFTNLVGNSIKFTPIGGDVYIHIDLDDSNTAASFLSLKFRDNGKGISESNLPFIFDRFYQVDNSETSQTGGTGIGLSLIKELVNLLGGSISAESKEGKGTIFFVKLPIKQEVPKAIKSEQVSLNYTIEKSGMLAEILIKTSNEEGLPLALLIEDHEDVLTYLASCLQGQYRLQLARNGREGIEKALVEIPDIIISDVMMPEKDGYEVLELLKNDERTSHIPFILLTAKSDLDSRLKGLERGADAYLSKPFEKKELDVRLRKLIELRLKLQKHFFESLQTLVPESDSESGDEKFDLIKETKTDRPGESNHHSIPLASSLDHAFVLKVRKVIQENLDDSSFGVENLCRELALSHSQVHRKLIALTGLSATHFIRYVRLVKAKELLKKSWLTISSISHDCGFTEPAYFSRVFKKEFGISPHDWRELNSNSA